ncbi:MAG: carboxypeptidase regulatory-like domain-containing protein [Candidatus Cloacimonetes bacterium]|nr:carboxypeptidase regulatory-like domain-containing protein [Candidatus Cloacimonadota bacterium]
MKKVIEITREHIVRTRLLFVLLILSLNLAGLYGTNIMTHANQGLNRDNETVEIELGDGTQSNTMSGAPTPYGTYYKSFRQQYLIKASELITMGGGTGNIQSLAFNVASVNNCSPMPNYRIRLKHTLQNALIATYETGNYQTVYQADSYLPVTGWNQHSFSTPFLWDGVSNLLVDVVADIVPGNHTQNASVYYTNLGYNSSLRFHSDTIAGDTATSGTVNQNRSNMKIVMQELFVRDLAAVSITGDAAVITNTVGVYNVTVKSLSTLPISDYLVRLIKSDGTELATIQGTTIQPFEENQFNITWIPAAPGIHEVYGKAVLADDDHPENNTTPPMLVHVIEPGYTPVQIGQESQITDPQTDSTTPYGTYYASFRQQYLFTAAELNAHQGAAGTINYLAFDVQALGQCTPMHNYRISLKTTARTNLSETYFEDGYYQTVFQKDIFMPQLGINVHPFATPFSWNGTDNIIVEVHTDFVEDNNHGNTFVYYTPTSFVSCLRGQSQVGQVSFASRTSAKRPNTLFFFNTQPMGALTGNVSEDGFPVPNVDVRMGESAYHAITDINGDYVIESIQAGVHVITASKHGYPSVSHTVTINEGAYTNQDFELYGVPEYLQSVDSISFGEVINTGYVIKKIVITNIGGGELSLDNITLTGNPAYSILNMPSLPARLRTDESAEIEIKFAPMSLGTMSALLSIQDNLRSRVNHTVHISGIGISADVLTLGEGDEMANVPIDFFYNQSIFETIITAEEMQYFNGTINGLRFYYLIQSDGIFEKHHKIWMGTTTETGLTNGWIRPNELTLVFDGNLSYPAGSHTIDMILDTPFEYTNGENLVMLFYRDNDMQTYTLYDRFRSQTWGVDRSLYTFSYWDWFDPIYPETVQFVPRLLSGTFPKTTFLLEADPIENHTIFGTFSTTSWDLENIQITANDIIPAEIDYDPNTGDYSIVVPVGWSGSVVPSKEGYIIEPLSRDYTNVNVSYYNQDFVVKKVIDPSQPEILYPEEGQVFNWEEVQPITITWTAGDIVPEYYEINFNDSGWVEVGQSTEYTTSSLDSGDYTFLLRGVSTTPQSKNVKGGDPDTEKGASEVCSVSFTVIVKVSNDDLVQLADTELIGNYPNPFNPETTISYNLKEQSDVRLQIFNIKGQLVNTLINDLQPAGKHNVVFKATDKKGNKLSSGIYLYKLQVGGFVQIKKMMLME